MAKPDISYFMGQGKVHVAPRQANGGIIGGYVYMGDCDALQVSNNQTFDDVMENVTGNRNIAAHIPTGNTQGFKLSAKQWSLYNASIAMYAAQPPVLQAAGSVTAEILAAYGGTLTPLANPGVSAPVAVLGGGAAKVASVAVTVAGTGGTPGDVLAVQFTGGAPSTPATANAVINAAGGIDHIEMTNYGAGYGSAPTAAVAGITAPTLVVNMGGTALVLDTDYTLNADMGSVTWLPASTLVPPNSVPLTGTGLATPVSINYNYASWTGKLEAFTASIREYSVRFEGLNTANDRAPVLVTLHRVSMNAGRVFDLIAARSGTFELDGMLLMDSTRNGTTESQYWTMLKV
jgi:hypothetical protein